MQQKTPLGVPKRGPGVTRENEPPRPISDAFIVHGTDTGNLRLIAAENLHRRGIRPSGLEARPESSAEVLPLIRQRLLNCHYVICLWTPDDLISGKGGERYQPRPNVFAETFYALANRAHADVLWLVDRIVEPVPSNFSGRAYLPYSTPNEFLAKLSEHFDSSLEGVTA